MRQRERRQGDSKIYMGKRERERKRKKNEWKGQAEGVMEEQMNRDLITRPLCPESVG